MGNHLPTQVFPVENYLPDLTDKILHDAQYESSLGSTRFLKVMKCRTQDGLIVVKVFVINDPSLQISRYREQLYDVSLKLEHVPNCLQYHIVEVTERAGFMIRQYVKSSLYDRISTRPFLTLIEKKWIAFQLLYALKHCHQENVCHGDIKLENILVSSWTWLVLSDFNTVKPVLLPENNPADYTYFFDTSRRRTCYIAPERFFKSIHPEDFQQEIKEKPNALTPSMDIFSAGCALAELFTEGCAPFDLTQLLAYRVGEYSPDKVLDKIDDKNIRNLILHMIQKDPKDRLSASEYLNQERERIFPENFYTYIWPFFKQFAVTPILPPDERIKCVKQCLPNIFYHLGVTEENQIDDFDEKKDYEKCDKVCEGLILISSILTSSLRALHFTSTKLMALELLGSIAEYLPADIILDRISPYIFELLKDRDPKVRVDSLTILAKCLTFVKSVPKTDINIFPEYIIPNLSELTQDEATVVRQAYAENIADIADTAVRFLDYCYFEDLITWYDYESEYAALQDIFHQKVAALFSDSANVVKRTLMEKSVAKLCVFFGRQKANDVLLSHMITFLNDKKDSHLRLSFFRSVIPVATYIGYHCADIIKPLLLQGVSDNEEFVVLETIETMASLTEVGIFPDYMQCELLADVAPLLIHPNLWIRHAVVGMVVSVAKILPHARVLTSVMKHIKPYLVKDWVKLQEELNILSCLRPPISREVYEALIRSNSIDKVLSVLQEAQVKKVSLSQLASSPALQPQELRNILRRLVAAGFGEDSMDQLFLMRDYLNRIQRSKSVFDQGSGSGSPLNQPGVICLDSFKSHIPTHQHNLLPNDVSIDISTLSLSHGISNSPNNMMNEEWQTMFGGGSVLDKNSPVRTLDNKSASPAEWDSGYSLTNKNQTNLDNEHKDAMICRAPCKDELSLLIKSKKDEHLVCVMRTRAIETQQWKTKQLSSSWKPQGSLLIHLHEHKATINRLVSVGDGDSLFASCSNDGTTKIWDCRKTERTYAINKSKSTYSRQEGRILSLASCHGSKSLAASSNDGSIHVISLDRMNKDCSRQLDITEDGYVVDMNYFDTGSQSMLIYATVYGSIVGWDLRAPGTAFRLENGPNKGVLSSIVTEVGQNWLVAGTSSGYHVCWDLRFRMAISSVRHARGAAIRRLKMHPLLPSSVISAHVGNNEISIFDMETRCCNSTLWASDAPPLSTTGASNKSVYGMHVGMIEKNPFILSVGTDSRLRYWDLTNPENSRIVCYAPHDKHLNSTVSYDTQVVEGTKVIVEMFDRPQHAEDIKSRRQLEQPSVGHKDVITDVLLMNEPQNIIVTSGFDGTIKMWK